MAGGLSKGAPSGYLELTYEGPWGGLQLDQPATKIDPGAATLVQAMEIRSRLTTQPVAYSTFSLPANFGTVLLQANLPYTTLAGLNYSASVIVTNTGVYWNLNQNPATNFVLVGTFTTPYSTSAYIGHVVIGNTLYITSGSALGVWALTYVPSSATGTLTEISAQNGSGPFIGANFLGTVGQRLILANLIGGDGNTTGTITGINVPGGGAGTSYPASGTFTVIGGGGAGAAGTYTTSGGAFSTGTPSASFTFTSHGTGYVPNAGAQVELVAATGSGAVLNAVVSSAITPSTTTYYPDYFAWSFPNAFGQFDPNNSLTPGGFDQLTEARGLIGGMAVFQSVVYIGHNGGITEVTENTASNIVPFQFYPLWSADQGVLVRFGTMAQYGDTAAFLGYDNAYILNPQVGLKPIGDKIASAIDFSAPIANSFGFTAFATWVEIEGEKHYLLQRVLGNTYSVMDYNIKSNSWYQWNFSSAIPSCPISQLFDVQAPLSGSVYNSWILQGFSTPSIALLELAMGRRLVNIISAAVESPSLPVLSMLYAFRQESPALGRMQTIRRILVEYENEAPLSGKSVAISTIYSFQNSPSLSAAPYFSDGSGLASAIAYPSADPSDGECIVLQIECTGAAVTGTGTRLTLDIGNLNDPTPVFITKVMQVMEIDKDSIQ